MPRLEAPAHLSQSERKLFEEIVRQAAPSHITRNDAPLLGCYCQAYSLVGHAHAAAMDSPDNVPAWEKAVRVMINLARQLRLTTRSRVRSAIADEGTDWPIISASWRQPGRLGRRPRRHGARLEGTRLIVPTGNNYQASDCLGFLPFRLMKERSFLADLHVKIWAFV